MTPTQRTALEQLEQDAPETIASRLRSILAQPEPDHTALIEKLETAHAAVSAAVQRQWDGGHALEMSIPARLDSDTDLILADAIQAAITALRGEGQP